MSAEVETMFSVKETPWHGLGVILGEAPTVEQGLVAAGLDWKVQLANLQTVATEKAPGVEGIDVDHRAVIRETDKKALGVVGPRYTPLQNSEAFAWFDPFLQAGDASLETAGSLYDGRKVWVLAKLKRAPIEITKGDAVEKFLLLSNSHDGTTAVRVGFTPIRVVCKNTLAMAVGDKRSQLIRVMHSAKVEENLKNLRESVNAVEGEFQATVEAYKLLATKSIHQGDIRKYVKILFYPETLRGTETDREKLAIEKMSETVGTLFERGRGNDLTETKGTYWALYNAVTEYLSYNIGDNQSRRLDNLWFKDHAALNKKALEEALVMVAA